MQVQVRVTQMVYSKKRDPDDFLASSEESEETELTSFASPWHHFLSSIPVCFIHHKIDLHNPIEYCGCLPFGVCLIGVTLVLRDEIESLPTFAQYHLGDLNPVVGVGTRHQRLKLIPAFVPRRPILQTRR